MRAAIHDETGHIINVIVLPDDYDADSPGAYQMLEGLTLVALDDDTATGPGWRFDGTDLAPPDPPAGPAAGAPPSLQAQIDELTDVILAMP